jgi:hypothetical protein
MELLVTSWYKPQLEGPAMPFYKNFITTPNNNNNNNNNIKNFADYEFRSQVFSGLFTDFNN